MLTYKKLLPQGIVGRHHLPSAETVNVKDEEESEIPESQRSEYGTSVASTATFDTSEKDSRSKYDPVKTFFKRKTPSFPSSRIDRASQVSKVTSMHEFEGEGEEPPARSISGTSYYPSVSTMTDRSVHYVTKNVIEESRLMSKKRAPGVDEREFPLRSQSSGLSHSFAQRPSVFGGSNIGYSPLKLQRVYGRNDKVAVLNFVGVHFSHIAYTAANVVVVLDFYNNQQRMLQGHKNKITCMTSSTQNTYFASGDFGPGAVIIIWDTSTGHPVRTLPVSQSDGDFGVTALGFVGEKEYIGSIGNDMRFCETQSPEKVKHPNEKGQGDSAKGKKPAEPKQQICIWSISRHEAQYDDRYHQPEKVTGKPTAVFAIPRNVGRQREILFCSGRPEFFVTTGDKRVVCYTWLEQEKQIVHHVPQRGLKYQPRFAKFTRSIWTKNAHSFITGTDTGFVIIWTTPIPLGLQPRPDPNLNIKEYYRAYKVGDHSVTALTSNLEWYIIGDEQGVVKFFDSKFRLVRWTKSSPQMGSRPITFIACNQTEGLPAFKKEMQENFGRRQDRKQILKDWTFGEEKYKQPSQTTLERPPLVASDFVIGCEGGDVHYCHLAEGRANQLVFGTPGEIAAMDTCPNTTHITISTLHGEIHMYDFITNTLIFAGRIFKSQVEVTCLKFHPTGSFAFFGMRSGQIYFRRAYTWTSMEAPLDNCTACIEKIVFSRNGTHMAHFDNTFAVTLYHYNSIRNSWSLCGKHRSHYRPIVDLAFFYDEANNMERLFSLGEDKYMVEYDIDLSSQAEGLRILERYAIDTQFVPTAMNMEAPWRDHKPTLIIANTGNKIKFFDQDLKQMKKHCQGPTYGTPVDRIIQLDKPYLEHQDIGFLLMTLGNKIGLMKTPVDGNAFKYMAVLCHPIQIKNLSIGCTGKDVFTSGVQDDCLFCWEPNFTAVETCVLSGGPGIAPYLKMLDGDLPPGQSLVEDVENVFYHFLIRRSKSQQEMLSQKLEITIIDMPLVLRTCGTFLTEYMNQMMIEEALAAGKTRDGMPPTMISFEDFVKLFVNYREYPPITEEDCAQPVACTEESKTEVVESNLLLQEQDPGLPGLDP